MEQKKKSVCGWVVCETHKACRHNGSAYIQDHTIFNGRQNQNAPNKFNNIPL